MNPFENLVNTKKPLWPPTPTLPQLITYATFCHKDRRTGHLELENPKDPFEIWAL